jgi:hypothetical protein
MTDNYEFNRSMDTQSANDYSPYTDKQYNSYINDINSGVYQNNGLSLVQFDLSSIYNSSKFTDTNDLFVVLPIVMVAAFSTSTAGTLVAAGPQPGNVNLLSLKNNFIHLIHQADLTINGKTAEDVQPFINISKHFQMLSEMSSGDLDTIGYSIGMTEPDNWKSKVYNGSTSATVTNKSGNGMTNNRPFVPAASFSGGSQNNNTLTASQFDKCVNTSIQHRLGRYTDTTAGNTAGMYGNSAAFISNLTQLKNDFTPTYEVIVGSGGGSYMVWFDYAVIKLATVFESLTAIGLTRKADIFLRLYVNTGTLNATISNPNSTTPGYSLTVANNGFTGTCPFTINYLTEASASGGIPATTANITAGLYLAKVPATSYNGINLGNSGASHPLPACRIYYSQITIQPSLAEEYILNNRAKKCIYRTVLTNQYNNITAGGNFNQLISSGIVHPTGILIVPYVSSLASFSFGDFAFKSPFDTVPADGHPLSLTNLQVTIGGQNVLQSVLNYNYESFIEQLLYCEQLTSADFGVSTGLFDAAWWNYNRFYWVNVERSNITDKLTARNLNISFTNNNNVPIDVLVFTFKSNSLTIDVETGIVSIP